jgi:hypothetical protein
MCTGFHLLASSRFDGRPDIASVGTELPSRSRFQLHGSYRGDRRYGRAVPLECGRSTAPRLSTSVSNHLVFCETTALYMVAFAFLKVHLFHPLPP